MADAQGVISDGQSFFAQALTDVAPDFLFLGFVDSLLGL